MALSNYFSEFTGSTVSSLISNAASSAAKMLQDLSSMNIGSSVSSDKTFEAISQSNISTNVFGVFDTKQVAQELSGGTANLSTELLDKLSPDNLQNLQQKTQSALSSDASLQSAVNDVMDNMSDIKQKGLSSSIGEIATVVTKSGAQIQATLLENVSLSEDVSSMIPQTMSTGDFSSLQNLFNASNGFGNFNSCDALAGVLGYGVSLINLAELLSNLQGLFSLLSQYDITGIIQCAEEAFESLDNASLSSLSDQLIDGGAVNSFSELTSIGNNGNILDKYDTVRSIGANTTSSSSTTSIDTIMTNLGMSKSDVFTEKNNTGNTSILDSLDQPVYNLSDINNSSGSFASYCLGGDVNTLSAIPSSALY